MFRGMSTEPPALSLDLYLKIKLNQRFGIGVSTYIYVPYLFTYLHTFLADAEMLLKHDGYSTSCDKFPFTYALSCVLFTTIHLSRSKICNEKIGFNFWCFLIRSILMHNDL